MFNKSLVKCSLILLTLSLLFLMSGISYAAELNSVKYPGVRVSDGVIAPKEPIRPTPQAAPHDGPDSYFDGCHVGKGVSIFKLCTYGATKDYDYTIAMVGDSHTAHWLPAFQKFAEGYKIRILYATKTGCAFSAAIRPDYLTCNNYNNETYNMVLKEKPDVVIAKADQYAHEGVPPGFLSRFRQLNDAGIKVLAFRNTAYWHVNVPKCVKQYGQESVKCRVTRESQQPRYSNWDKLSFIEHPPNVKYVDYSSRMCDDAYCYPVQGNILKIRDAHHMTASYTRTFSSYILRDLLPLLKEARMKRMSST